MQIKDCKTCARLRRAEDETVFCAPEADEAAAWVHTVEDWEDGYPVGDRHADCPAWQPKAEPSGVKL